MCVRRCLAALPASFVLLTAAANAQISRAELAAPVDGDVILPRPPVNLPNFQALPNPAYPAEPRRSGLIAAYQVRDNLTIGVGRFVIPQLARLRTNVGSDGAVTGVQRRQQGMAAIGMSIRF